jgi:hypothetical protein
MDAILYNEEDGSCITIRDNRVVAVDRPLHPRPTRPQSRADLEPLPLPTLNFSPIVTTPAVAPEDVWPEPRRYSDLSDETPLPTPTTLPSPVTGSVDRSSSSTSVDNEAPLHLPQMTFPQNKQRR